MAQKQGWKESLVWSQALVNANDCDRFKALQWGIRTRDIWNFTDCDFRFGDEWPGKKRGVIQADREDTAPGGGTLLPAWNPRGGSDSPSARYPHQGLRCTNHSRLSLPSATSAGGSLWVESLLPPGEPGALAACLPADPGGFLDG
jgi:hypothetical protein